MSSQQRIKGVKVLKAVSSPVRLGILSLLFDRGPLSYTELMNMLKMNPSRDAGRFAYHLKFLLKADLVEADVESKKYRLTELGRMVINVAEEIEKKGLRAQKILVRTSRYSLEEFDVNRITNSLIKEANMPADLAQKVAKETEKRLLKSRIKYLTAPLIREVVNAVLIERGLEEYRHKLTRLGLPVHDVTALMLNGKKPGRSSIYEDAGRTVFEEYTLLNVLPRDASDAHLSGNMHIHGLGCWMLKPSEVIHDLRFFLKDGLKLESAGHLPSFPPPKSFEAALTLIHNVCLHSAKEVDGAQTLAYFNIFLAPFIRGVERDRVKEALRLFILNLSHHVEASIDLEPKTPSFMENIPAVGDAEVTGYYGDFAEESQLLAKLTFEVIAEESTAVPLINPTVTVKMREDTCLDNEEVLMQAHSLASQGCAINFANIGGEDAGHRLFSTFGCKLDAGSGGDWEVDTLRTAMLGYVTVNVPRCAYESDEAAKFHENLKNRLEIAAHALDIKYKGLINGGQRLLPFLTQKSGGDRYLRIENSASVINLAGVMESAEYLHSRSWRESDDVQGFALETVKLASEFLERACRRGSSRIFLSILPLSEAPERLARLDIEKYGVSRVRFQGTRENPYYSTLSRITFSEIENPSKALVIEGKICKLLSGGSLAVIDLEENLHEPSELLSISRRLMKDYGLELLTYIRHITYCHNCGKSWFGLLRKCPSCGNVSALTQIYRHSI
ncbi:MAG: anaerobic ribonucleoside-triphosphate reductase [Nitrososphaerota archaeon]|nr:ArsR family transcriptional regulator [Candidatus Bathyarchaeota archaeon]MDW8193620.1 anaerobic ribonucleoside-triphosphate reductase [Nitrososphaerota archaeon]